MIFGENKDKSISCIEIKEFILQISKSKFLCKNEDLQIFEDSIDSNINLIPHKIYYVNYSEKFLNKYQDINKLSENNQIIPNIDDKGIINGSYLMLNVN